MVPLAETNASRAVCRTRHLTAFGAGMFVPDNVISIIVPVSTTTLHLMHRNSFFILYLFFIGFF